MIAAENPRLAIAAPVATPSAPSTLSLLGRLGAMITRAALAGAADDTHAASDEGVWTSVARGF